MRSPLRSLVSHAILTRNLTPACGYRWDDCAQNLRATRHAGWDMELQTTHDADDCWLTHYIAATGQQITVRESPYLFFMPRTCDQLEYRQVIKYAASSCGHVLVTKFSEEYPVRT